MNLYRVGYRLPDNSSKFDDVKAGDLQVESGCLIFRKTIGTNSIIMAYKSWDFVVRVAVDAKP